MVYHFFKEVKDILSKLFCIQQQINLSISEIADIMNMEVINYEIDKVIGKIEWLIETVFKVMDAFDDGYIPFDYYRVMSDDLNRRLTLYQIRLNELSDKRENKKSAIHT